MQSKPLQRKSSAKEKEGPASRRTGTEGGAHVRVGAFKTASMLRHAQDGDWRCLEDTYIRRFAVMPLDVSLVRTISQPPPLHTVSDGPEVALNWLFPYPI